MPFTNEKRIEVSDRREALEGTLRERHSLSDLGIVVLDEGDSVHGVGLEERVVEDGADVVVLGLVSGLLEVVCFEQDDKGQRHSEVVGSESQGTTARSTRKRARTVEGGVEDGELSRHAVEVTGEGSKRVLPEFSDAAETIEGRESVMSARKRTELKILTRDRAVCRTETIRVSESVRNHRE